MGDIERLVAAADDGTVDDEFLQHLSKGGELLAAGKADEAKDVLEKAFALQPKNPKAQNLLGLTYFKLGVFDRAAEIYELLVRDNPVDPTLRVNLGLVYLKVMDAEKASYGIQDYRRACVNLAQTTMRAEIGKLTLDNTFSEREKVNEAIVREIDKASETWGVKVMRYEIRNINPSAHVIETLEKQMEAERSKRAKILLATAEKEAVINLSQGEKQEAVNLSEGARQQRINEANGRAQEITLLAEASAHGIERVGQALCRPGGDAALKMRVVEQYIEELGVILQQSRVSVVPAELANIKGFFEGMSRVGTGIAGPQPAAPAPRAKPAPAKTL